MNQDRLDQLIVFVGAKKVASVCDAVYKMAAAEVSGPKRGSANCQLVAEWLGLRADLGIYLLFAFTKDDVMHEDQTMSVPRTLKMLERLKAKGEIYYD